MRLLNSHTLKFEVFEDDRQAPPYAIFSHTWGKEELSYEDVHGGRLEVDHNSEGARKIFGTAAQAKKDGYDYFWVDTCKFKSTNTILVRCGEI
jgi:hypothetical protein